MIAAKQQQREEKQQQEQEHEIQDPLTSFMYGLKAAETKRQWPRRLKIFLDYIMMDGTFEQKARQFLEKAIYNPNWAQDNFMKFIAFQHQRAIQGEISETTIANYYKAAKPFCEMNDLILNWTGRADEGDHCNFTLDTNIVDTNIVKGIHINRNINAIIVEIDNNLVSSTIHLEAFSEKTIKPLKKDLSALLKENKDKQAIINSIVTCIIRNNNNHYNSKRSGGSSNARVLVELASVKENAERFFKDQYGRPYVAVRLGKAKQLTIMPLKSSKYKHCLAKLFRENRDGEIVGEEAINSAINSLAADAEFDGETIPLHLRVAWGRKENLAREDCIYYDMTDAQRRMSSYQKMVCI